MLSILLCRRTTAVGVWIVLVLLFCYTSRTRGFSPNPTTSQRQKVSTEANLGAQQIIISSSSSSSGSPLSTTTITREEENEEEQEARTNGQLLLKAGGSSITTATRRKLKKKQQSVKNRAAKQQQRTSSLPHRSNPKEQTLAILSQNPSSSARLKREEEIILTDLIQQLKSCLQIRKKLVAQQQEKEERKKREEEEKNGKSKSNDVDWNVLSLTLSHQRESNLFASRAAQLMLVDEEDWAKECGLTVSDLRHVMYFGQRARIRIVSSHAKLVQVLANKYHAITTSVNQANQGMGTILSQLDLIQEGNMGLLEGAERFDAQRGCRFQTYATYWVRQRILASIEQHSRTIRLPSSVHAMNRKINKSKRQWMSLHHRNPTLNELAQQVGTTPEKINRHYSAMRSVLSLERPLACRPESDGQSPTLGEYISTNDNEDSMSIVVGNDGIIKGSSLCRMLVTLINKVLLPLERQVVMARFGLDNGMAKSIEETARTMKMTREKVRLLEAKAMTKLRNPNWNYQLKDYVKDNDLQDYLPNNECLAKKKKKQDWKNMTPEEMWAM